MFPCAAGDANLGYNTATGAYLAAKPAATGAADTVTSTWAGTDGSFTFEALVRLDFDPLSVLDSDQLPDAWETANFGNLDQTATGDFENDGTNNRAEYLLGLNPKDGASFFKATVSGGTIQWQGVAGLSFVVQRSTTLANASWADVSTQTGVDGLNSYTDPSPPVGKAFYRVLLVMP